MKIEKIKEWVNWVESIPLYILDNWEIVPSLEYKELKSIDDMFTMRQWANSYFILLPNSTDMRIPIINAYWTCNIERGARISIDSNDEIYKKLKEASKSAI